MPLDPDCLTELFRPLPEWLIMEDPDWAAYDRARSVAKGLVLTLGRDTPWLDSIRIIRLGQGPSQLRGECEVQVYITKGAPRATYRHLLARDSRIGGVKVRFKRIRTV